MLNFLVFTNKSKPLIAGGLGYGVSTSLLCGQSRVEDYSTVLYSRVLYSTLEYSTVLAVNTGRLEYSTVLDTGILH